MDQKKTLISTSIMALLGTGAGMMSEVASASLIADGSYIMTINNTPLSGGVYQFGSNGNWNSSFTMGCLPGSKGCGSQAMYDDAVPTPINGKYSGVPNDGVAGSIAFNISSGIISVTNFNMDTISGTPAGEFNQYGSANLMTGFVDNAGLMAFTPTGRLGVVSGFPALVDEAWNVDNYNGGSGIGTNFAPNPPTSNTAWQSFTSGQACASGGCIDGTNVVDIGDVNFDGINDYTVVLVSAGQIGSDWGGFFGADYYEVWASTTTITSVSTVPIPAAAWLFGSGLLGLAGIARKKT